MCKMSLIYRTSDLERNAYTDDGGGGEYIISELLYFFLNFNVQT